MQFQNAATGTGSIFNRQGGSIFNRREHIGKYDLVIGNQPDDTLSFSNVNHALFFAKKGGVVVAALDTSVLTDCSENGLDARNTLFSMIRVTGVLNGGDLDVPLYLMFAVKLKSSDSDIFYILSPAHDEHLRESERFRIDYSDAQPIQFSVLRDNPSLINVLATGTTLDADVIRRIHALLPVNEKSLENDNLNEEKQNVIASYRPAALRLGDYWELNPGYIASGDFPVKTEQSLFSFSSEQYPDRKNIEKYLYVVTNSELFHYYMLMTTLGLPNIDQVIYAEDIVNFPIIAYEQISLPKKDEFQKLMLGINNKSDEIDRNKLNEWVCDLYQLDTPDQQVITDTLATRAPNKFARSDANTIPDDRQVKDFCSKIESSLKSFCSGKLTCRKNDIYSRSWIFIDVFSNEFKEGVETYSPVIKLLEKLSENEGATRVILNMDNGYLCVATLAQKMYFTKSRAQLCALEILRHHADFISESVDG